MCMAISVPRYTVEDLERFPDDGNRYELLDGLLLVTPAQAPVHQIIASRIQAKLVTALQEPGFAHVVGPGAVIRKPNTQLQPDILVYPSRFKPRSEWVDIDEHWLAVEVLSRSSRVYDREFKRDAYFALGVQQVWLVDWRDAVVEVCTALGKTRSVRDEIVWHVPAADVTLRLRVAELFSGI